MGRERSEGWLDWGAFAVNVVFTPQKYSNETPFNHQSLPSAA